MGTTAAILHLLRPGFPPDYPALLKKAYARLGWVPPKRGEAATRHAVLRGAGEHWLTLQDSACAALDDGTLKELAALLGKPLGGAAAVTTVQDSDAFAFILYDKGRQVDAVGDGLAEDGLAMPRGKRQANAWAKALAPYALRRALAGEPTSLADARLFAAEAAAAEALESAFAEERLAAWCALAGIPPEAGEVLAEIALVARPGAAQVAAAPAGRMLAAFDSPDDCPYHAFHPAPWPCALGETTVYRWLVTCRGGGIEGLTLHLDIARADGAAFRLREVHLRALPFFNGQATSLTPLAEWGHPLSAEETEAERLTLPAHGFSLRAPAPGSRSQAILILRVGMEAPAAGGEAEIRPVLHVAGDAAPLTLPSLRLRATALAWQPLIAPETPDLLQADALLRLNAPSLRTAVALVEADAAARPAIRALFETVMARCTGAGLVATLRTEKTMTPSFRVPKGRQEHPVPELAGAKGWAALFDPAARIQTLVLGIAPPDAPAPLAGLVLQASLHDSGPLAVALWMKPEGAARLGLDWESVQAAFRAWMAQASPLQGWEADCAWLPIFDRAEAHEHTPYEIVVTSTHARMQTHNATQGDRWRRERLLFVAPRLWLGATLAAALDRAALAQVAEVASCGRALAVTLRPGQPLTALEAALRPILPEAR